MCQPDRAPRLATLLIGSVDAADEVVHDAFVYRHSGRVDRPGGYLRTAVVNRCRSQLRRRRVAERVGLRAAAPAELEADELGDALAHLPDRQRTALILRYYADWPEADIAALLGVRPATVRTLVMRGLARLREEIEP